MASASMSPPLAPPPLELPVCTSLGVYGLLFSHLLAVLPTDWWLIKQAQSTAEFPVPDTRGLEDCDHWRPRMGVAWTGGKAFVWS